MSYYVIQEGNTKGPYTMNQIKSMWATGALNLKTLHCKEGDEEWTPLETIMQQIEPDNATVATLKKRSRGQTIAGFVIGSLIVNWFLTIYYSMAFSVAGNTAPNFWALLPFSMIITFVYFLPYWLAQNHPNSRSIFLINALLGWTIIGWLGAMIWAIYKRN